MPARSDESTRKAPDARHREDTLSEKPNILILTVGHSGSSVLAGFIARAGYWLGDETGTHRDYNTNENRRLNQLDGSIFKATGYLWPTHDDIPPPRVERIRALPAEIDLEPYREFIATCNAHTPHLLKSPLLSYTIHFWARLLDLSRYKLILIRREHRQIWTGTILKGGTYMLPYRAMLTIGRDTHESIRLFREQYGMACHEILFEDLLIHPEPTIDKLNRYLGTALSLTDLQQTYRGELYRRRWSPVDTARAVLKYCVMRYVLGKVIVYPRYLRKQTMRWRTIKTIAAAFTRRRARQAGPAACPED